MSGERKRETHTESDRERVREVERVFSNEVGVLSGERKRERHTQSDTQRVREVEIVFSYLVGV